MYSTATMEQTNAIANTQLWSHWHNTQYIYLKLRPCKFFWSTGFPHWFKLIYRSFGLKSMHCTFYMYCGIRPKIDSSAFFFISLRFKIQEFILLLSCNAKRQTNLCHKSVKEMILYKT